MRRDPAKLRAWRRRSVERYEDRLRQEHDCPFRDIGTNRKRRQKERERAYGPPERREFVTRHLPCVGCGRRPAEDRPNHQHHTRTGGTGRKADADTIVPLCPECHRKEHDGHGLDVDWESEARRTDAAWRDYREESD